MNKLTRPAWLFFVFLMFCHPSCGVNTGNPKARRVTKVETTVKDKLSVVFSFKSLDRGSLGLNVKGLKLIPAGEPLSSSNAVAFPVASSSTYYTGQDITAAVAQEAITGTYDRIALVLDSEAPAVYTNAEGQEAKVAVAPYAYYAKGAEDQSLTNVVMIVLSLDQGDTLAKADGSQQKRFAVDFKENLKSFSAIDPSALMYYQSQGDLQYEYTLGVAVSPTAIQGSAESSAVNLEVIVKQDPTPIRLICIYKYSTDAVDYASDSSCRLGFVQGGLDQTIAENTISFELEAGVYTVVARGNAGELIYSKEVGLPAGQKPVLDINTGEISYPIAQ